MTELVPALVVALLSFGSAIFYVLSAIERPVWRLGLEQDSSKVSDEDARFVHMSLKRLIPLLPPSFGVVLVWGTAGMLYQAVLLGWDWATVAVPAFYWLVIGSIILFCDIRGTVRDVQEADSEGDISVVRCGVARLVRSHHLALIANFGAVVLQLALVIGPLGPRLP
jgi:hypothetical protein